MASKKFILNLLEQEVEDFIQTQAEKVISFEDDPMAYILKKYPSLNDTLTDLMTKHFGDYVMGIYVMAPKPTTFKILLHNGQFFYLMYAKDSYIAKIQGKKYYLLDLGAEEYATKAIADLLTLGKPPGAEGPDEQEDNVTITDTETETDVDITDDGGGDEEDLSEAKKEEEFKPHMMYDPKTGEGKYAKVKDDHLKLKAKGWGHDKPKKVANEKKIRIVKESVEKKKSPLKFKIVKEGLSPAELSKDATLPNGVKTPRIEILIKKIQNDEELELTDGSKFTVTNKEEVLSQLKGKDRITKSIILIDKDDKQIATSKLKKTDEFGGGGGMRGGSDLTAKAESAQCIVNEIRYSKGKITLDDVNEKNIQSTRGKVQITDFDGAAELLNTNTGWVDSSVSIANELASNYSGPFIQNRGSDWVKTLEATVKPKLKEVGINDINKWSPADIWMVAPDEMNINWPNSLNEINSLLLKKYNEGKIIGVSLKKAGKEASLKIFNDPTIETTRVKYKGIDPKPNAAKALILFDDSSMEFRNFSGLSGFQGEIIGKKAAGGKVGYSIIKKALNDNGIELTSPNEIKDQVIKNDPDFKSKFKRLWDSTEGLDNADFERNFNNPEKTPNQNLLYRISKYLALEVVNSVNTSEDPDEIVNDLINYASSSTDSSAIFVKAL